LGETARAKVITIRNVMSHPEFEPGLYSQGGNGMAAELHSSWNRFNPTRVMEDGCDINSFNAAFRK
jgi:hypothetical protein